ncbi:hypothetical protein [Saccharophagus degradans]|uniref:Lipoprotein n=1 Tax=Saccharophagus degradans (strain 2-40 / ATCC 43961 / DSM 17024) TaxID=203122 RepID=Q21GZ0_SACD2|nr:hypothetical protein [Saccharophagus degradans]ABD82039.1 hypothetical protein Sde_2779 [Saccharophagus degradans 2-40]
MEKKQFLNIYLMLVITFSVLAGCSKQSYSVKVNVASTSGYGVVLYNFPVSQSYAGYVNVDLNDPVIYVHPNVPGEWTGLVVLPPFKDFEGEKLPDSINVEYQYAELSECSTSYLEYPLEFERSGKPKRVLDQKYYTKRHCKKWHLLPDKRYNQEVDLTKLNESQEMKLLGSRKSNGNRIGVVLHIEFRDDGSLRARLENTTHNMWK